MAILLGLGSLVAAPVVHAEELLPAPFPFDGIHQNTTGRWYEGEDRELRLEYRWLGGD